MIYCPKCGAQLQDDAFFCTSCGATIKTTLPKLDTTNMERTNAIQTDINQNKGMAVLAYLGLLWLIPFFCRKESAYTQYHCKQGFNLLLTQIGYSLLSTILTSIIKTRHYVYGVYIGTYTPAWLTVILGLISIPLLILAIMGIINAVSGQKKELPIIGKYKILK